MAPRAHRGGAEPSVHKMEFGKLLDDLTNIVKMVEYKSESVTHKYFKFQTPPHMKKQVALGDFMHFETLFFFSVEMGQTKSES